ncbi:hypothetical protein D3C81_1048930 [compost metagenome]
MFTVDILGNKNSIELRYAICVVIPFKLITNIISVRVSTIIDGGLPQCTTILLGIQHFHAIIKMRTGGIGVYCKFRGTYLSFFCRDDNNTIRCA